MADITVDEIMTRFALRRLVSAARITRGYCVLRATSLRPPGDRTGDEVSTQPLPVFGPRRRDAAA